MQLFIDRLPFNHWTDPTRTPALTYWTVVLPVILTEPTVLTAPPVAGVEEWVLDTGNRGEAFAWRHHLIQAGLDPDLATKSSMAKLLGNVLFSRNPMFLHALATSFRVRWRDHLKNDCFRGAQLDKGGVNSCNDGV